MELERTNFNAEIVLGIKQNHLELLFFEKLQELHSKVNPTSYFFKKMFLLPQKHDCP